MWLDKLFLRINDLNVKPEYEIFPSYFNAFIADPLKVHFFYESENILHDVLNTWGILNSNDVKY